MCRTIWSHLKILHHSGLPNNAKILPFGFPWTKIESSPLYNSKSNLSTRTKISLYWSLWTLWLLNLDSRREFQFASKHLLFEFNYRLSQNTFRNLTQSLMVQREIGLLYMMNVQMSCIRYQYSLNYYSETWLLVY